ncbi:MAG: hypothetical protein ACRC8K_21485 [Waterburya sp.]
MFKVNYLITVLPLLGLLASCTDDSNLSSVKNNFNDFSATETIYVSSKSNPNIRSVYTDIDLDNCEILEIFQEGYGSEKQIYGSEKSCSGYNDIPVFITELDGRYFVDVGRKVDISNLPLPFNHLGEKMEWRLQDDQAFAVIYRYHIDDPQASSSSILAVNKIATEQEDGCVIAFIFGTIPNANEIARHYADERTASFKCGIDQAFLHINE